MRTSKSKQPRPALVQQSASRKGQRQLRQLRRRHRPHQPHLPARIRKHLLPGEAQQRPRRVIRRRLVQRVLRSVRMLPARSSLPRRERRVRRLLPSVRPHRREGSLLRHHDRLLHRARPASHKRHHATGMAEQHLLSSALARHNPVRARDSALLPAHARHSPVRARGSMRLPARGRCPGPPVEEAQVIPVERVHPRVLRHRRSVRQSAVPPRSKRNQRVRYRFRHRSW